MNTSILFPVSSHNSIAARCSRARWILLKSNLLRKWGKIGTREYKRPIVHRAALQCCAWEDDIGLRQHRDIERTCKLETLRNNLCNLSCATFRRLHDGFPTVCRCARGVPCKIFVNQLWVIRENNVATCLGRMSRICSSPATWRERRDTIHTWENTWISEIRANKAGAQIHDMHIHVNLNLFGEYRTKATSSQCSSLVQKRSRHARYHAPRKPVARRPHEQESTILPRLSISGARQKSHYANPINGSAVSDTRIKDIDAVARVWNTLSSRAIHLSATNTCTYLREGLPVADRHIADNALGRIRDGLHNFARHASCGAMK